MIEFNHREIIKITELLDLELDRLNSHKIRNVSAISNFTAKAENGEPEPDYYDEERKRYDRDIEFVKKVLEKFEEEISKVTYKFGSGQPKEQKEDIWKNPKQ